MDPRFWKRWKQNGAAGDKHETSRRESIRHFRRQWRDSGHLSGEEMKELEGFEFRQGPDSVDEQVRRYILGAKAFNPSLAEKISADTKPILERGVNSKSDVEALCRTLHKYVSGFLIRYDGASYSMTDNMFYR